MKRWMLAVAALALASFGFFSLNQTQAQQMQDHGSSYLEYSAEAFGKAKDQKRVLFFSASWCPTCRAANAEFTAKLKEIPKGVVVFKADYDKETALKRQYGIVRQHTFVLVDATGKALKTWSGGAVAEVAANTK
ncbi:MAG: thioredoxin family protein [Meiothermus sp.]|nr:thioredoxin family protein [Meiothermus sp.]